jgi:ubiquinone/menaquinone biosynthesis C-methylase UbiE
MTVKTSKGYKGVGMDGLIAVWYAMNTHKNLADYHRDARLISESVPEGAAVLEVAPGPGYLSIELARLGKQTVSALDISPTFVEMVRANAKEAGVAVDVRQGDVAYMPFEAGTFDFIYCRAAFKNFAQPVQALDDMYRVLKPGGKASIVDLRGDVSPETVNKHVDDMGLDGLNRLMTKWAFKFMLIKRAYTKAQFQNFVAQSKFKTCQIEEDDIGLEIKLQK